jgi:hypothetical protein
MVASNAVVVTPRWPDRSPKYGVKATVQTTDWVR